MPTSPYPNHPPTDNSSHHHPDDHSHDQLFNFAGLNSCISHCEPKQPSLQSIHHGGSAFSWIYLGVHSGCRVEVRFLPHQLFTQVPQGSMLGAVALCHIHNLAGADHPLTCFFIPLLCRWHPATPVVSLNDPSVSDNISNCLSDISALSSSYSCWPTES